MPPKDFSKTKIIATLGPSCSSVESIRALLNAGADCLRINFSHGRGPDLKPLLDAAREACRLEGVPAPILADVQGPKLRIGQLPREGVLLQDGGKFTITSQTVAGSEEEVSTPHREILPALKPGAKIFLADGTIELQVEKNSAEEVQTRVVSGGRLYSRKGMNLPGTPLPFLETVTPRDREDLAFIAEHGFDMVAISFVRKPEDLEEARRLLRGKKTPVMAKIERPEALGRIGEILEASDGIMLARGDLGVEVPLERVPILQKEILAEAASRGKWTIVATQMLSSMTTSPRPTRAEVSDVANAILDGADVLMLSDETATGSYPVQAVETMMKIALEVERSAPISIARARPENSGYSGGAAGAAVLAAERLGAKAIVTLAGSGLSALLVSKQRPMLPVLSLSAHEGTLRRLNVLWGITPVKIESRADVEDQIRTADKLLLQENWARMGDTVVVVAALPLGQGRETNTIRFHHVGQPV
ncbi:MAG: pyruvate kinase [Bdellovibrionota bacterium]